MGGSPNPLPFRLRPSCPRPSECLTVSLQLLEREEEVAVLQRDLASYKATHSCSNASYESQLAIAEALRQVKQPRRQVAQRSFAAEGPASAASE